MTCTAYIGLGSNLEKPVTQLRSAVDSLRAAPGMEVIRVSSFYRNPPMGPQTQPDYVNAVVELSLDLTPDALMDQLEAIENAHGRQREGERWGPRTLDLDILLYGEEFVETPRLTIPHPGMAKRPFVLKPLLEIAPDLVVPGLGAVEKLLEDCDTFWLETIDDD